jgi:hypothetical protein
MLCLSPEQLISKGFADLLKHKPFCNQFCALGVDKIHVLYLWGTSFCLVFQQIEFIHLQCPPWIVTMGLSATVAKGHIMDHVCKFLGYQPTWEISHYPTIKCLIWCSADYLETSEWVGGLEIFATRLDFWQGSEESHLLSSYCTWVSCPNLHVAQGTL